MLGVALPALLSSPCIERLTHGHQDYSWKPFDWSVEEAPGIFDTPRKIEEGAPLQDGRRFFHILFHRYVAFFHDMYVQIVGKYEAFLDWMGSPSETYIDPSLRQKIHWKEKSSGLYVFIHGIHGHPSCWNQYKKMIEAKDPHADVCLIKVKNGGDCRLEEAVKPIFHLIKDYSNQHRTKPVALVGTSRGAPITASLELKMRQFVNRPKVYVATIAGVHHGSIMMNLIKKVGCDRFWFTREATEELAFESDCAKNLLEQQKAKLTVERKFRSDCTTEEFQIQPCTSAFSQLKIETMSPKPVTEERFYVHGSGHISIVDRVREHLVGDLMKWMGKEECI